MPQALLVRQLETLSSRLDRELVGPALGRVSEYAARGPRDTTLAASDGAVVVQGLAPADIDPTLDKRSLFLELQRRGHAAAPVNTPAEAARDPWLPAAAAASSPTAVRFARRPRILDLTHLLAGPFATYLLDLTGADVVKVERPESGDPLRLAEPAQFASLNGGKTRITLDVTKSIGAALLARLAAGADLVIENMRGGAFRRRFPRLPARVLSLPGLAAEGPYAAFRSYAPTVHAMLGLTHVAGPTEIPWADYVAGAWAANRALDLLSSVDDMPDVLPQAACLRALRVGEGFAWPVTAATFQSAAGQAPLGEHNDETYRSLGLSEREIDRLYVERVL